VEIVFLRRVRPEIRFPTVEALRQQIAQDVRQARRYFHLLSLVRGKEAAGAILRGG
jgi:riboflavin kinase/FMN adenylyltransferase